MDNLVLNVVNELDFTDYEAEKITFTINKKYISKKIESLKIKARKVFVQIFLFLSQIGYCMLLKSRNSNNAVVI